VRQKFVPVVEQELVPVVKANPGGGAEGVNTRNFPRGRILACLWRGGQKGSDRILTNAVERSSIFGHGFVLISVGGWVIVRMPPVRGDELQEAQDVLSVRTL
jgi:hypothetical protein